MLSKISVQSEPFSSQLNGTRFTSVDPDPTAAGTSTTKAPAAASSTSKRFRDMHTLLLRRIDVLPAGTRARHAAGGPCGAGSPLSLAHHLPVRAGVAPTPPHAPTLIRAGGFSYTKRGGCN